MIERHEKRPEIANLFRGLHVIADDAPHWKRSPLEQAMIACIGGASVIQLRCKNSPDSRILEWACAIRKATRKYGSRFVVNDRFDIALAAEADAVHLGQDDFPPNRIPENVRKVLAVGRSTHTLEQAKTALKERVDYVAYGPVFDTQSKKSEYSPRGLPELRQIAELLRPQTLVAIGGIQPDNLERVLEAGVASVAVISAVWDAANPQDVIHRISAIIENSSFL